MRSNGQAWAIEQLDEIAREADGTLEVVDLLDPDADGRFLVVTISIFCRDFPRRDGGVPLSVRERIRVSVPWDFPLSRPDADFSHDRHAGFPHVQWGHHICLYQAPEIEWQPSQGIFGLIDRLVDWLKAAAAAELDPAGMPLHPPVAYATGHFCVIPRVNAPVPNPPYWGGNAVITIENDVVAELGQWIPYGGHIPDGRLASAILLPTTMPFEYPTTMLDLIKALVVRGVPLELIHVVVELGVLRTNPGLAAIFLLGAAMRGTAGGERLQHLACWRINAEQANALRAAAIGATPENPTDIDAFYAWAGEAKVDWCRVLEDRPEIVVRRDSESPASWWLGRHVAILGCGAIGSAVAMMLARAGVAQLDLFDNDIVTPGVLVRQNFQRKSVGYSKSSALRQEVLRANPDLEATAHHRNVLSVFRSVDEMSGLMSADVILDATAATSVATALELHFRIHPKKHPPVIAMSLGHNADVAMMTGSSERSPGMSLDLDRRTKIAFANSTNGLNFLEEFWPVAVSRRRLFQPEPGCSAPTFRGSFSDVLSLTARMTNVAARWLVENMTSSRAFAINLSGQGIATGPVREIEIGFHPCHILRDARHGYEVRIGRDANSAMLSWIRRSERTRGARTETGGVLFGELDELLKIVWIDEVSGPPPDSIASPDGFICGTAGVSAMHDEKRARTRGSVGFVGMWHTHPGGLPIPSPTDLGAMKQLLQPGGDFLGRRFVMLIVGGMARRPMLSTSIFDRSDYA